MAKEIEITIDEEGKIEIEQRLIYVQMQGQASWPASLSLSLLHPTQAQRDHTITLQKQSSKGDYLGTIGTLAKGHWHIMLEPPDRQWRLKGRVHWPQRSDWLLAANNN